MIRKVPIRKEYESCPLNPSSQNHLHSNNKQNTRCEEYKKEMPALKNSSFLL